MSRQSPGTDHIDARRAQWAAELPDVDTRGMAVLGRMRRLTLQLREPIEAVFAKHGLDTGTFDIVATLLRSGSPYRLRPTELYKSLMISSGGLTDRLRRLEETGLIERTEPEGDARSLPVQLTARGREIAEAAFREDMAVEARLLAGLSDAQQQALAQLLRELALSLES